MSIITTYTNLQTAITDYVAKSNLATFTPNFVQNWEERFYRQPRNHGTWMELPLSVSISGTAALPSDYLALRVAYLNGQVQSPLNISSLEQIYAKFPRSGSSGIPKWIARDGANFVFGPLPNGVFTLNGTYYAKPAVLRAATNDGAANWLLINAPDLVLYGCLAEAEPFLKNDERVQLWKSLYQEALHDYRDLMKEQKFSGGAMQVLVA